MSTCCCAVAKSCPTLWPHRLQHVRLACPSLSWSLLRFMSFEFWWCCLTISSSAISFSFCLQSFPAARSFPMSQPFVSDGQNFGASALASVLPMNNSGLISFRIDWLDLLAVWGTVESSPAPQLKSINSSVLSLLLRASLVAQTVKNLPAMQKTWVEFLGWEDLLVEETATHSSILAWRIPWTEEPGGP